MGGWISDSIGRLRAIAIGSVGGVVGFAALLLAPTWQWMIVALAIYQFPFALVGPSFSAFIAENSSDQNRGKVYGITDTIYGVTGVLGPPLGGLLAGAYGFKMMLVVAAAFYAAAAGLRIWMANAWKTPGTRVGEGEISRKSLESHPRQARMAVGASSAASFKKSMAAMVGMVLAGGVITWIFVTDSASDIAFRLSASLPPSTWKRWEASRLSGSAYLAPSMPWPACLCLCSRGGAHQPLRGAGVDRDGIPAHLRRVCRLSPGR